MVFSTKVKAFSSLVFCVSKMSSSDSFYEGSGSEVSVTDKMMRQLARGSEELTRSLERFGIERHNAIQAQKLAFVEYDEEMRAIEEEFNATSSYSNNTNERHVDHNVLRHLNIDRNSDAYQNLREQSISNMMPEEAEFQQTFERKEDKLRFPVDLAEKPPMPNPEEKKKIREQLFDAMENSQMEEMRLELEWEQAKLLNDHKLADELGEALYLLQKMNAGRLKDMLTDYQPVPFGKNWGTDPEYLAMIRNINEISTKPKGKKSKKINLFEDKNESSARSKHHK